MSKYSIQTVADLLQNTHERECKAAEVNSDWMWSLSWSTHVTARILFSWKMLLRIRVRTYGNVPSVKPLLLARLLSTHMPDARTIFMNSISQSSTKLFTRGEDYPSVAGVARNFPNGSPLHCTSMVTAARPSYHRKQ